MSPRFLTAVSVSMLAHFALWAGYFWNAPVSSGRRLPSLFENSVLIDPSAYEAVRKAREAKPAAKAPPPKKEAPAKKAKIKGIPTQPNRAASRTDKGDTFESAKTANVSPPDPVRPDGVRSGLSARPAAAVEKTGADLLADPKTRGLFADYFGLVKARIQSKLRENVEGKNLGRGSVALAFVLRSDGRLHRVYVMDNQSQANPELKALAVECLRQSAPFSGFPSDFRAKQIAFNLTVYFDNL